MFKYKSWIDRVERVRGDTEGRYGHIRLDKNEQVRDIPPLIWEKIRLVWNPEVLQAYPEPEKTYQLLSKFHQKSINNFLITSGADAGIKCLFDLCVQPHGQVVALDPTFAMVRIYCDLYHAQKRFVSFPSDLNLNPKDILSQINSRTALVVIANPNSPTGTFIETEWMERIAQKALESNAVLLIDEAYADFDQISHFLLSDVFYNVAIVRTFSKAWGLAGLRIGYIYASEKLAHRLYKFRPMYEASGPALLTAQILLKNWDEVKKYCEEIRTGRLFFIKALDELGLNYIPTKTNFIHVDVGKEKQRVRKLLSERGILVHNGLPLKEYQSYLRITLASTSVMKNVVQVLEEI